MFKKWFPEVREASYHSIDANDPKPRFVFNLSGAEFCAVTIGQRSDVDKAIIQVGALQYTLGVDAPVIAPIDKSLVVYPFYLQAPQGSSASLPIDPEAKLELELWPEIPPVWPVRRGPRRILEVENANALDDTESTLGQEFAIYGRREVRFWFRETLGQGADIRLEVGRVRDASTVDWNAVWPTAGDETAFQALAASGNEAVVYTDGGQLMRVRSKNTTPGLDSAVGIEVEMF